MRTSDLVVLVAAILLIAVVVFTMAWTLTGAIRDMRLSKKINRRLLEGDTEEWTKTHKKH